MNDLPKLDNRSFEDLLKQVEFFAKQYTPEWNFDKNSSDFGIVFAKAFCKMTEGTISLYNRTLYNYYLTFLNMLGTRLKPAFPASGMVVVNGSQANNDGAYIDKGMEVFAICDDIEDGVVIYETTEPITVINASIDCIYSTDPKKDFINLIYDKKASNEINPFRIFDNIFGENLQTHEIYFKDDILFNMSCTDVDFLFYNSISAIGQKYLPKIFFDKDNISWEYFNGKNWVKTDTIELIDNGVRVKFNNTTIPTTVMGKESRFIRCKFKRVPDNGIFVTSIKYNSNPKKMTPDLLLSDEEEIYNDTIFPFGEEYTIYSKFVIKSDEIFTKKDSTIKISANLDFMKIKTDDKVPGKRYKSIMTESDFADIVPEDIKIETVSWEYWNGKGWSKLKTDENGINFFKFGEKQETKLRIFEFECPDDLENLTIGSKEGFFIRAKIIKTNKKFDFYANYIVPVLSDIFIEYCYKENREFENIIVNSDLNNKIVILSNQGLSTVLEKNICNYPAIYLCLTNPIKQGIIRIFIEIEEAIHRFNPTIKWEYLAKNLKDKNSLNWKHLDVIDSTENLSHSGTVTMIGKNDFEQNTLFGNTGYFVRIINPNGKYSDSSSISSRPIINDIKFNAVKVLQVNSKDPEYFSIEQNQENKVCKLSSDNISNVVVWVDETNNLSSSEQDLFLNNKNDDSVAEYDEFGNLKKIWIKWEPVYNLKSYGLNDRVYEIDYPKGEILFGNGKNGKIPPEQYLDSIKVDYCICNGSKGNLDRFKIVDFLDTVPLVQSVENTSPILGGVDMETINDAASRMFSQISGGNRIVSLNDFEDSICFNDRNIYKVKCLTHIDENDNPSIGAASIAVLPRKYMQGHDKFQSIKKRIWEFMDYKAPATLSQSMRLKVFEVLYVETSVLIDVVAEDFNYYQIIYNGIETKLKKFLDPITGNFSGKGWNIGQFPRKEFIYNYIKTVPHIKWIKNINIFTKLITPKGYKELDFETVKNKNFVVPVFGVPDINITLN